MLGMVQTLDKLKLTFKLMEMSYISYIFIVKPAIIVEKLNL